MGHVARKVKGARAETLRREVKEERNKEVLKIMQIDKQEHATEIIEVWNELYHGEPRESDQGYSELQREFMQLIRETLNEMDKKEHRKEKKRTRHWKPILVQV